MESIAAVLENLRIAGTIITPLICVFIVIMVNGRNKKREELNRKMDELLEKIEENEKNCRDDIKAVAVQAQAFQQDIYRFQEGVASKYPPRAEITEAIRDLRNEIRQATGRGR